MSKTRCYYKVVIGKSTCGRKFTWFNDCRKIEWTFQCRLVPLFSKSEANSLNTPPGAVAGSVNQIFTPDISGTPTVTQLSGGLSTYDYSGCSIGGDEFLLTDTNFDVFCMTPETACAVLARMFLLHTDSRQQVSYTEMDAYMRAYERGCCMPRMYRNGIVSDIMASFSESNPETLFTLHIFAIDPDTHQSNVYDVCYTHRSDRVYKGYYPSINNIAHFVHHDVETMEADLVPDLLENIDDYTIGSRTLQYSEYTVPALENPRSDRDYKVGDGIQQGTVESAKRAPEAFIDKANDLWEGIWLSIIIGLLGFTAFLAWRFRRRNR